MRLLNDHLINPTLYTVQTALLIAHFLGGEGDNKGKYVYVGIARLHAEAIRLWDLSKPSPLIDGEICRRTWLSVVVAEKWAAADLSTHAAIDSAAESGLNMSPMLGELEFSNANPNASEVFLEVVPQQSCIWAQMAKTIHLYSRINELLLSLSRGSGSIGNHLAEISVLAGHLDEWAHCLPYELTYKPENIARFANRGLGRTFLSMHIGYHHFRQLLFYPFLDPRGSNHPCLQASMDNLVKDYGLRCKTDAIAVSDIARISFATSGCELMYFLTGHILVVSSSIHLHTLLSSEDLKTTYMARERLKLNFELMMYLKPYWTVLEESVSTHFLHFVEAQLRNRDTESLVVSYLSLMHHRLADCGCFNITVTLPRPTRSSWTSGWSGSLWDTPHTLTARASRLLLPTNLLA